jgi:hypothetical protein
VRLTLPSCTDCLESESLNFLELSGPVQACTAIALPLTLIMGLRVNKWSQYADAPRNWPSQLVTQSFCCNVTSTQRLLFSLLEQKTVLPHRNVPPTLKYAIPHFVSQCTDVFKFTDFLWFSDKRRSFQTHYSLLDVCILKNDQILIFF